MSYIHTRHTVSRAASGYVLLRHEDGARWTVVGVGPGQVFSAMPGDSPAGGGRWFSRATDAGIRYVSSWYSRGYAQRIYRQLVAEQVAARS